MKRTRKQGLERRQKEVKVQLETDQRTYGSINREASPAFAGWKDAPVTDLIAVLNNEKAYDKMLRQRQLKVRRLEEEDECAITD